jgi:hypothetical protein
MGAPETYMPPTDAELLTELGTLSAHKYLSPSIFERRELIIEDLIEREVLEPSFDNPFPHRIATLFDFVGPDKETNEHIYSVAFSKQLLRSPNDNEN